jgi:hypothetical protein
LTPHLGRPAYGGKLTGAFAVFVMPAPYPPVAYVDTIASELFAEAPLADDCLTLYRRLRDAALNPREAQRLLAGSTAEQVTNGHPYTTVD